jgi:hypothetical protein
MRCEVEEGNGAKFVVVVEAGGEELRYGVVKAHGAALCEDGEEFGSVDLGDGAELKTGVGGDVFSGEAQEKLSAAEDPLSRPCCIAVVRSDSAPGVRASSREGMIWDG